jgi:hypothetical protein
MKKNLLILCVLLILIQIQIINKPFVFSEYVIDVRAFGAKGDGFSDDIKAFELAINTLPEWGTLYIPNGIYRISKPIVISNKYRIKIRNDGVIKPLNSFSGDYLVKFINNIPDKIVPSMGMNIIIDNLVVDCEWKTRGVLFDGIYDFSIKDLHIWRPYGHGIKIKRAQEGSFWKPAIFSGKERINIFTFEVWNSTKTYKQGDIVRINFPSYNSSIYYPKGTIVNYKDKLYRSLKDSNQGNIPVDNPDFWEWVPFEYYVATDLRLNINKNPLEGYTTRNPDPSKRYWRPLYPDEAALEIVSEGEHSTIDNVKFFNLIIRSSTNNPSIRIDNIDNPLKPLKIELYAPQIHVITEPYIDSFNKNKDFVNSYGGYIKIPENMILLHVPNSRGFKIIGGNFQLGTLKRSKGIQFGTLGRKNNPGCGNTSLTFLNSFSIEGNGYGQVGISIMPSVKIFSKWFQEGVFFILKGDKSLDVIDIDKELHQKRVEE